MESSSSFFGFPLREWVWGSINKQKQKRWWVSFQSAAINASCPLQTLTCDHSPVCHQLLSTSRLGNGYSKEWFRDYLTSHSSAFTKHYPALSKQEVIYHKGFQTGGCVSKPTSWPTSEILIQEVWGGTPCISSNKPPPPMVLVVLLWWPHFE